MKARGKTALGIALGAQRLSVTLVERSEQGLRIVAAASEALPAGEQGQPGSASGKVLPRLLSRLGRRSRVRSAPVAVTLAVDSLVLQLLDLSPHLPANVGEFVRSELQQYVTLAGKNVISDFCSVGAGMPRRLLAVAADVDEIEKSMKACGATGLAVEAVEPSVLAYARAWRERHLSTGRGEEALIAVLGPRVLTVALFLKGTLDCLRIRTLPEGTEKLPALCAWLAEELRAVVRYYETQVSEAGRARQTCLIVDDGIHQADELRALLPTQGLLTPVSVVDACEPWPGSPAAGDGAVSTAALGAALGVLGTAGDGPRINLLPKAVQEAQLLSRHVLATALAGVVVFLGLFVTAQLLARTTGALDRKIEQTRLAEEFYTAPALMAQEKFLDQEILRCRQHLEPLRKALAARQEMDWPGILEAVRRATPGDLGVTQLQCGGGRTLWVKGLTASCPAAEMFVRNLEKQSPFASVALAFVHRSPDTTGRLEYRIDCILKGTLSVTERAEEPPTKGGESL